MPPSRAHRLLLAATAAASLAMASTSPAPYDMDLPSYHYAAPIRVECMNRSSYVAPYPVTPPHPSLRLPPR